MLAFIVVLNWNAIKKTLFHVDDKGQRERRVVAEPSGDKAAELEAAEKLSAFKDKNGSRQVPGDFGKDRSRASRKNESPASTTKARISTRKRSS